ncbi:unnamed protein product [Owenia fusiformis]|uniref:Uncharacterized protein n=1 Tax=Owenia fusiformis TaxID=6347 RepID=A0A8J1XFF1_OWEFU|nr:unnamed protein product [Owenia fusiformis]
MDRGDRPGIPDVVIVVTDGKSDNEQATKDEAIKIHEAGINTFVVGVGDTLNTDELNMIATDPDFEHTYFAGDFDVLVNITQDLVEHTCFDPVCKDRTTDIVFILDGSSSITADEFLMLKDFVKNVVNRLDTSTTRVGLLTFATGTNIDWNLNKYGQKSDLLAAINEVTQIGGSTHTAEAIRVVREQMFTTENGDRIQVPNVIVLVTDGVSKDVDPLPEAQKAKDAGIAITCVGVGNEFKQAGKKAQDELNGISSDPDESYVFEVGSYAELEGVAAKVTQRTCYPDVCGTAKIDLAILLDRSASIPLDDYLLMLTFTKDLANKVDIDAEHFQIAVVTFSDTITTELVLNQADSREKFINAIDNFPLELEGATNHADVIALANDVIFTSANGDRPDASNLILIITDGVSTVKTEQTVVEANRAMAAGITMIAIGIGPELTENNVYLGTIASDPDELYVYSIQTFTDLNTIQNNLLERSLCPSNNTVCSGITDIIFALDRSGSISTPNFEILKSFIIQLLNGLDIGENKNRIGVLTFSDNAEIIINLNEFFDVTSIVNTIQTLQAGPGATYTANAMAKARDEMFIEGNGDRPDIPNVLVLISDGVSTVNPGETAPEALASKQKGITLVTVAIGDQVNDAELSEIASSRDFMFNVTRFEDLPNIETALRKSVCNDEDDCTSIPCLNGGICIDELVSHTCQCPADFSGFNCNHECNGYIDLVFVLDTSGSIFEANFDLVKTFVKDIILNLPISSSKTRVGAVSFATSAQRNFYLNTYFDNRELLNAIERIPYTGGATNIAEALQLIRLDIFKEVNGDRASVPNVVVLITDGASTVSSYDTLPQANLLKNSGAHIVAIGVGNELKPSEIRGMATDPDADNALIVENFFNLRLLEADMLTMTCFDTDDCTSVPCQAGGQCIDKVNSFECVCPNGRSGPTCSLTCNGEKDVVILVDSSGSIGEDNFKKVTDFVHDLVDSLEIHNGLYQVGVATFADDAVLEFHLNTYEKRSEILNAISSIQYTKGATNTAGGIELARTMFSPQNGDRINADNLLIIVTDGVPRVRKGEERSQADTAKANGIQIKTIGVGPNINADKLKELASSPTDENVRTVIDFNSLGNQIESLRQEICA